MVHRVGKRGAMTSIYFVRHAQSSHDTDDERRRPLTAEGMEDRYRAAEALRDVRLDVAVSSPYRRSVATIEPCAREHGLPVCTDERLRERMYGPGGNGPGMFEKRWADLQWHEEGGESLAMVQQRNIAAVFDLLERYPGKNILLGTHGTALSTILRYFDPAFGCGRFLRIIDWMPYVVRLDFEGRSCVGKEEIMHVEKPKRA